MRCPHCAGEILDGSRFCGICGRRLAPAPARQSASVRTVVPGSAPAPAQARGAMQREGAGDRPRAGQAPRASQTGTTEPRQTAPAPIELPVSRGARWARILLVLALDVALASAGVAMILAYARDCAGVGNPATAPPVIVPSGSVTRGGERRAPETRP